MVSTPISMTERSLTHISLSLNAYLSPSTLIKFFLLKHLISHFLASKLYSITACCRETLLYGRSRSTYQLPCWLPRPIIVQVFLIGNYQFLDLRMWGSPGKKAVGGKCPVRVPWPIGHGRPVTLRHGSPRTVPETPSDLPGATPSAVFRTRSRYPVPICWP